MRRFDLKGREAAGSTWSDVPIAMLKSAPKNLALATLGVAIDKLYSRAYLKHAWDLNQDCREILYPWPIQQ